MSRRVKIPEKIRKEIIRKSNNKCCICQTPFIQIHHLDEDPSNNDQDNLAPLCPNCHDQANLRRQMSTNLTPDRIIYLRDKWYEYCEARKEGSNVSATAILKLKALVRYFKFADISWKKTFQSVSPEYGDMSPNEIIDTLFQTTNPDELKAYLEAVKGMYLSKLSKQENLDKFKEVCSAFGVDYDDLI